MGHFLPCSIRWINRIIDKPKEISSWFMFDDSRMTWLLWLFFTRPITIDIGFLCSNMRIVLYDVIRTVKIFLYIYRPVYQKFKKLVPYFLKLRVYGKTANTLMRVGFFLGFGTFVCVVFSTRKGPVRWPWTQTYSPPLNCYYFYFLKTSFFE